MSSSTINLSCGERPVNSPVSIAKAPVSERRPCPCSIVSSTNSAGVKFQNWFPVFFRPIELARSEVEPKFPNNYINKI